MKKIEYAFGEGHFEMIRRVWEEQYGSHSLSNDEIALITNIGFAMMKRTELIISDGMEKSKVEE
jgi:hypothetical protein